jgi:hypothetical protein
VKAEDAIFDAAERFYGLYRFDGGFEHIPMCLSALSKAVIGAAISITNTETAATSNSFTSVFER